ncbi:MAG: maltose alpha-D-glucosyltransferase [Candidatus Sericytochromatia bacterium]
MPHTPSLWYKDAIFYEVSTRTFRDGNGDGIGDFIGLTQSLDYIRAMGVDCIWLLPMYPSPLGDDGYDISNYTDIHPDLGTIEDFRRFMAEAKSRGLRVIADLVLNHTSSQHPWFQEARKGPDNPFHDWYVWTDDPSQYKEARIIFTDTEDSNWTWDDEAKRYYWHRFFSHQPDLNFENPAVHDAMLEIFKFWMELGLDGFRADAIPYLYEEEGTNCENLPRTHDFLKKLRAYMDEAYPEAVLLGEANQWPEDVRPYFGDGDELHMSFHFPIMPRMFMSLRKEDREPLEWIIKQTPDIPPNCQWATFLRNHDELTLEMVTEEERTYMYRHYAPDPRMKLNVGIRRRLWPLMNNDRRQVELLYGLLVSLPGSPVLYYGDEIGMGDNIYLPDRFGCRTPMQWNDNRNAGFSTAHPSQLYLPVNTDPLYNYHARNVEIAQKDSSSFYHWVKDLITLRKHHRAFSRGEIVFLYPENTSIFAFMRKFEDELILVVANLSSRAQPATLDLAAFKGRRPIEMMGDVHFPLIEDAPYTLTLGAYQFYWFRLIHG